MNNTEQYIKAVQELAAARIQLKMAMKLLKRAHPLETSEAATVWKMQLEGLIEEVSK